MKKIKIFLIIISLFLIIGIISSCSDNRYIEDNTTATIITAVNNYKFQVYYVWIPKTGEKYHIEPKCSGMKNPSKVTEAEAKSLGYTRCKKCW